MGKMRTQTADARSSYRLHNHWPSGMYGTP
jgi:hypothetical protein